MGLLSSISKLEQSSGTCTNWPGPMQILLCSIAGFLNLGTIDIWDLGLHNTLLGSQAWGLS